MVQVNIFTITKILNFVAIAAITFIGVKRIVEIDNQGIRSAILSIYYLYILIIIIKTIAYLQFWSYAQSSTSVLYKSYLGF